MSELSHESPAVPDDAAIVPDVVAGQSAIRSERETFSASDARTLSVVGCRPDQSAALDSMQLFARRVLDVLLSVVALIVLAIPSLVISALVKATSRGPVLFTQTRVGRSGETFTVLKFRTMEHGTHQAVLDDEADFEAYRSNDFKLAPDDERITSLGKFLRKSSLDELPQLVNVLRGDMSVVGIRPLLPDEVALRSDYDQELYRVLRPGMTGLWQVEGRSTVGKIDRIALDRRYVEDWSVGKDLWIIIRTPFAILKIGHTH